MSKMRTILLALALLAYAFSAGSGLAAPSHEETFVARLRGSHEIPSRTTPASGEAVFFVNEAGTEITYILHVEDLSNAVAAHIHLGKRTENGPVVVALYGPAPAGSGIFSGVLATGTITAANLTGPLAGKPLSDLILLMRSGKTYVNVHTNDGLVGDNTGPGDFAAGEIRGQIRKK